MIQLPVNVPGGVYEVRIGSGLIDDIASQLAEVVPSRTGLLIVDDAIADSHGRRLEAALQASGWSLITATCVADEEQKSLATVSRLYEIMLEAHLGRDAAVIALGGGIVGDIAGFVAATYLRGVPFISVPTTLLAMVDASIGGKTGVNHRLPDGSLGKNLIGSFWQPRAVLIDPDVLATLDERDYRCGLAESLKHAMLAGGDLWNMLEEHAETLTTRTWPATTLPEKPPGGPPGGASRAGGDSGILEQFIAQSAAVKVDIVVRDEREAGDRALLNLGHTFAHAFESQRRLDLKHGEAVAIGLHASCLTAQATGRLDAETIKRVRTMLTRLRLPAELPPGWAAGASVEDIVRAFGYDKKRQRGRLRLVLPTAIGQARIVDDVDRETLIRVLEEIGADRL